MNRSVWILVLFWGLTACGAPPPKPPHTEAQALSHHLRGVELRRQGEPSAAQRSFGEAYRLYASIEHREGSSAALLNLAALARQQAAYETAEAYLGQASHYAITRHKGMLAYEHALLLLQLERFDAAQRAASNALELDPTLAGPVHNLMARASYRLHDVAGTRSHLREALKLLAPERAGRERANAFRLLGRLEIDAGRPTEALSALRSALLLDKQLNLPDKLALDLRLSAEAAKAASQWRTEADYLRRLFVVSVSHTKEKSAREILSRLANLLDAHNEKKLAQELRSRSDKFIALGVVPLSW